MLLVRENGTAQGSLDKSVNDFKLVCDEKIELSFMLVTLEDLNMSGLMKYH